MNRFLVTLRLKTEDELTEVVRMLAEALDGIPSVEILEIKKLRR